MQAPEPSLLIDAASEAELLEALALGRSAGTMSGRFRLAMLRPTPERRARAAAIIRKGRPHQGLQDIWFSAHGLLVDGKLVFMYPGVDALERPDISDLAAHGTLDLTFAGDGDDLAERGTEVFYQSEVFTQVLGRLGVKADFLCGHSLGEWSAMAASGCSRETPLSEVVASLRAATQANDLVFVALGCGERVAREAIAGLTGVELSHDNCPHQAILCGFESSLEPALARLRERKVICQKLDFRSGFHSSFFQAHMGPLAAATKGFKLCAPEQSLWSATTCAPYPRDSEEIRALMLEHLLRPVRFRELTERLYAEGARVFLQVGAGGLTGFVADTLRGKPHLSLSAASAKRSGLAQLQRVCLALFVEGAEAPRAFLGLAEREVQSLAVPKVRPLAAALVAEMEACFAAIADATREVTEALQATPAFQKKVQVKLDLDTRPELLDHCFYKQKRGWKNLHDRFPVMPLTASIDLVMKLAQDLFPGRVVTHVQDIAATRWLSVEEPKTLDIAVNYDGRGRLKVEIVGHFAAELLLASSYPKPPSAAVAAVRNPRPALIPVAGVYRDGWLFHGPAYQGVTQLGPLGDDGLSGVIRAARVPGALLDNVGQLAGLWIMQCLPVDRYAMPIRIKKIAFYGPEPDAADVRCEVRCDRVRARDIMFHMELSQAGQVWAQIEGWEKWRFESDETHWQFILHPGRLGLSQQLGEETVLARPPLTDAVSDDLARRYLGQSERRHYQSLAARRQAWLLRQIAAKDAVRYALWGRGYEGEIFPAEVQLNAEVEGACLVTRMPAGVPTGPWSVLLREQGQAVVARVREEASLPEASLPTRGEQPRGSAEEPARAPA